MAWTPSAVCAAASSASASAIWSSRRRASQVSARLIPWSTPLCGQGPGLSRSRLSRSRLSRSGAGPVWIGPFRIGAVHGLGVVLGGALLFGPLPGTHVADRADELVAHVAHGADELQVRP